MISTQQTSANTLAFAPGVHLFFRDQENIQVGLDPTNSLQLPLAMLVVLKKCDGYTSISQLLKLAELNKLDSKSTLATLQLLVEQELLIYVDPQVKNLTANQQSHHLDASRSVGSQTKKINQRAKVRLAIVGGGRLGSSIALLLGNSGFSNLRVFDNSPVTLNDLSPWGASRLDVGLRRDYVIQTLLERIHRDQLKTMRTKESRSTPDLIIYAPDPLTDFPWLDPNLTNWALELDVPYLVLSTSSKSAMVTPVLNPGSSGCLRCYHQHQTDRDQVWPKLIAQLVGKKVPDLTPTDLILRTAIYGFQQICDWLENPHGTSTTWRKIDLAGNISDFEVPPHTQCGCIWQLPAAVS